MNLRLKNFKDKNDINTYQCTSDTISRSLKTFLLKFTVRRKIFCMCVNVSNNIFYILKKNVVLRFMPQIKPSSTQCLNGTCLFWEETIYTKKSCYQKNKNHRMIVSLIASLFLKSQYNIEVKLE